MSKKTHTGKTFITLKHIQNKYLNTIGSKLDTFPDNIKQLQEILHPLLNNIFVDGPFSQLPTEFNIADTTKGYDNIYTLPGVQEHLDVVKVKYPHIKTLLIDADNDNINNKYDIILHWGLLYHLKEIEAHLGNVSQKCDMLLLETEVSDSDDKEFYISTNEKGYDQAFNNKGIRPSPSYVEQVLGKNGFQFKMIKDSILNSNFHQYDWDVRNSKGHTNGLRRFWICWKNIESPLVN